jgi:hypothetical protein
MLANAKMHGIMRKRTASYVSSGEPSTSYSGPYGPNIRDNDRKQYPVLLRHAQIGRRRPWLAK